MTRFPRLLPCLALACSMTVTQIWAADPPTPAPAPAAPAAPADPAAPAPAATPAPAPAATPAPDAATPAPAGTPAPAAAPGAAPAAAPAAPAEQPATLTDAQQNQPLFNDVDDFWHYGKIARYEMAMAFANKILTKTPAGTDDKKFTEDEKKNLDDVLHAFETVAAQHQDSLDDWMLRWEGVDSSGMKGAATKLEALLGMARHQRRFSQKWIQENIEGLAVNERAYRIHLDRLRESGEMVVPMMIDYLKDNTPDREIYKDPIRRAMVDLGRTILNPLIAATETKDEELQLTLISVLSRIGYDVAGPYLSRIAHDRNHPGLAIAAASGLRRMGLGASVNTNVADQFFQLSEKFYYNNASIQPDPKAPAAYMWYWNDPGAAADALKYKDVPAGNYPSFRSGENGYSGLVYKEVPPAIFSDLMAEREAEYALQLGPSTGNSLALWLAANNKLEVDLPEGASAGVFAADRPNANYYNVYAGAQYLNAALTRSLTDHNAPVAVKLIKSLAQIVGPSSQGSGVKLDPLVQSMHYADRLVRFEAAFALASGLPNTPFPGHERVAPLLAEAVSQTGSANVLVIAANDADAQKLMADLKQYGTTSGVNPQQAFNNAMKLPAIDAIVFPETLGNDAIDRIYSLASGNPRIERASKVIITTSKLSPWTERTLSDPLTVVTQATTPEDLGKAVEDARKRAGGLPLDDKVATAYAVKAAQTLQRLAEGRVSAFDLSVTQPVLLASLNDKRPEVVKAVGEALAYMNAPDLQVSLLTIAVGDKTTDDVRVSLLQSIAKNVKFFGGHLNQQNLDDLQKQVDTAANLDVRSAAAEARGALNLPADQAKELIVKQAKR